MLAKAYREICVVIMAGLLSLCALSSIIGRAVSFASPDDPEVESPINHLHSSSKEERRDAVKYLSSIETDRASEGLISALDNSDREVRDAAARALAERVTMRGIGNRAVEGLIHGLDSSSELVRRTAATGLA